MNLAPNGQPSKLTPEQYRLVRTPEFKAWFGDWINSPKTASKVVDENGEPLVVLHGSNNKFNIFKKSKNKSYANNVFGFYFATNEWIAKNYGKYINYYFLNIRSIIKLNEMDFQIHLNYSSWDNNLKTLNEYKKKKINGIFYIPTIYVAFEPTQIKLADGTNTTFDTNNPDIRYANGGGLERIYYIPTYKSKEIIESFTHYKSGENYYPKTIWANWFMSASRKHKERIAREISGNNEFKNALISNWYDNYKKDTNKSLTFEEFLNKDIEIYRGQTSRDLKYGEAFGFESYTIDKSLAEHFAKDGNGLVITKIIKPKNTYGLIDSIGNEREIIIPTKYSKEFLEKEWYDFSNENIKIFDNLSDEDMNEFDELLEKSNYEGAIYKLKFMLENNKNIKYADGGSINNFKYSIGGL